MRSSVVRKGREERERERVRRMKMKKKRKKDEGGVEGRFEYVIFLWFFVNGTNSREDTLSYLPIGFSRGSWMDVRICTPYGVCNP